ncbi:hypothetical protein SFR_3712 [Streptomyces sp. FR-008]|nr:hypothetical protein SFR_3712 [Streptomyces sp. FR-008]
MRSDQRKQLAHGLLRPGPGTGARLRRPTVKAPVGRDARRAAGQRGGRELNGA